MPIIMNETRALVSSAASRSGHKDAAETQLERQSNAAEYISNVIKPPKTTPIFSEASKRGLRRNRLPATRKLREPPQGPGRYPRSSGGNRAEKSSRLRRERETSDDRAHVADGVAWRLERTRQWGSSG